MNPIVLKTEGLSKHFYFQDKQKMLRAVDSTDIDVRRGETLAFVGESGSGKTTLGKTMIRIYKPTHGRIWFDGEDITHVDGSKMRQYRQHMQMVFQDPTSALNPRKTVLDIISLPLKLYHQGSRSARRGRVKELLDMVELSSDFLYRYPNALSGGQKQRVGIARALALNPKLIVLDEPTAALDVSVQAKILDLLDRLRAAWRLTYIYISHDLSVVKNIADRAAVMYLGQIMEIGTTDRLFEKPLHPYTRALLSAIPTMSEEEKQVIPEEITLKGEIPSPVDLPPGCMFDSRCQERMDRCYQESPRFIQIEEDHWVRCHRYETKGRNGSAG